MGTSKRDENNKTDTPGPGAYNSPGKIVSKLNTRRKKGGGQ